MSKMGQELDRKLDENKYDMWEAMKYCIELHNAFNNMLGLRAKDEDIIAMLDGEMDILGARVEKVLAKIGGVNND